MSAFTQNLIQHPKRLFLIDAGGALLSAFLLGFVLVQFQSFFGIPVQTLYILAAIPCLFILLDLFFYFSLPLAQGLMIIGRLNMAYCVISIGFTVWHYNVIFLPGIFYLISEILIVFILGLFEVNLAKELNKQ